MLAAAAMWGRAAESGALVPAATADVSSAPSPSPSIKGDGSRTPQGTIVEANLSLFSPGQIRVVRPDSKESRCTSALAGPATVIARR
jgi:hypothetical protein